MYLDDLSVGDRVCTRGVTFTEAAIVDFGLRYDPQPFHIDVEAAAASPFGGLIASGFHTLVQGFRMILDEGLLAEGSIGSPGFDELRWTAPVRPGDTIHLQGEVVEVRPSRSKPDRGMIRVRYEAINQRGETVMSAVFMHLLRRRSESRENEKGGRNE